MKNFAKGTKFTLRGKIYEVLSNHVHDNRLPKSPRKEDSYNAVEFIEVVREKELGEWSFREVVPATIASQVTRELTDIEKIHDEYVNVCKTKVYPKSMLYPLLDSGGIVEWIEK